MILEMILALGLSSHAGAQPEAPEAQPEKVSSKAGPEYKDAWVEGIHWLYDESMKSEKMRIETAYKKPRKEVLGQASEKVVSKELRAIREKILQVDTGEGFDQLLTKLDTDYEKLKEFDSRFFVAMIMPLKGMRGLIWRTNEFVNENKKLQQRYLALISNYMEYARVFLPEGSWEPGWDFYVRPYTENESFVAMFKSERDLQNYFAREVFPALAKAAKRLQQVLYTEDKPFIWDNRIVYGLNGFAQASERYLWVEEADILEARAFLHGAMSEIAKQSAFSVTGYTNIAFESTLNDFGQGFFGLINGATGSQTTMLIKKYAEFGKLNENGTPWLKAALENLRQVVQLNRLALQVRKLRPAQSAFFLQSGWCIEGAKTSEVQFAKVEAALKGSAELENDVTAENVQFNLPDFYQNPPEDLKVFLPTEFAHGLDKIDVKLQVTGRARWTYFPNYKKGQASKWELSTYKKYFPEEKNARAIGEALGNVKQILGIWSEVIPF